MARKRNLAKATDPLGDEEGWEEFEDDGYKSAKERYTITVSFTVRSTDLDLAEDAIGDMISEAIDTMADDYKPDVEILDYQLDVEIAELP